MTEEDLLLLTKRAMLTGQSLLLDWAKAGQLVMGRPIFLHLCWPMAHKKEHYLFAGLEPSKHLTVIALSEAAGTRLAGFGGMTDTFDRWSDLQNWHEVATYRIRTEVIALQYQPPSGLVLLH